MITQCTGAHRTFSSSPANKSISTYDIGNPLAQQNKKQKLKIKKDNPIITFFLFNFQYLNYI